MSFDLTKYLAEGKLYDEENELYVDPEDDIETDEDGNITTAAYVEEFGHSFEEKQNWEKVLDQVKKKYNFDVFDPKSLKNFEKIKDEAKQIYIKKYGSPKYKSYPF